MSAAVTPSLESLVGFKLPEVKQEFTTFSAAHFIKPAVSAQPVKPAAESFAGYSEICVMAALDLDYDEPNAVVESELEIVVAGQTVHHVQCEVTSPRTGEPQQPKAALKAA